MFETLITEWGNREFCGGEPKANPSGGVEGVFAWTHPYGCSQMGGDKEATAKVLSNLVHHPNAGAVLIVSLGCVQKGGKAPVCDVLKYGEKRNQRLP